MEGVSGPGSGAGGWTAQHPSRSVPCREGFRSPDGVCFVPYSGFLSASRDWGRLGGLGPHWGFRLTAESLSRPLPTSHWRPLSFSPNCCPPPGSLRGDSWPGGQPGATLTCLLEEQGLGLKPCSDHLNGHGTWLGPSISGPPWLLICKMEVVPHDTWCH